jgi:hypothetical protein
LPKAFAIRTNSGVELLIISHQKDVELALLTGKSVQDK